MGNRFQNLIDLLKEQQEEYNKECLNESEGEEIYSAGYLDGIDAAIAIIKRQGER